MRPLMLFAISLCLGCATQTTTLSTPGDLVTDARESITEIDTDGLSNPADYIVIDVREPAEFADGYIPGAVNVPRGLLEFRVGSIVGGDAAPDPAAPILLYCRSGARGALAAQTLGEMGYTNVTNLIGGIMAWEAAGKDVEVPEKKQ